MSNMSYVRFENTARDLAECVDHWPDVPLSVTERLAKNSIIRMARLIIKMEDE